MKNKSNFKPSGGSSTATEVFGGKAFQISPPFQGGDKGAVIFKSFKS
ncbi:MAG: hypothetical protein JJT94_06665 [Bernardetiaceae bacterium]|nr:hypothetical protein [Bernardetiaceae bacterium]